MTIPTYFPFSHVEGTALLLMHFGTGRFLGCTVVDLHYQTRSQWDKVCPIPFITSRPTSAEPEPDQKTSNRFISTEGISILKVQYKYWSPLQKS